MNEEQRKLLKLAEAMDDTAKFAYKESERLDERITEVDNKVDETKVDLEEKIKTIELTPGEKGDKGDKGEKGEKGDKGDKGKDGKDGKDGKNGKDGRDGINGKDGKDGKDGEKGEKGDIPKHKWNKTKLSFELPNGKWGEEVDLMGKATIERIISGGGGRVITDSTLSGDGSEMYPLHANNDATATWGNITGTISNQSDLTTYIANAVSTENLWDRDAVNGYLYPKEITDGIYKEVTVEELRTLINNSQLGINQWYLLTDYKTVSLIAGSEPAEYHEGDIEQIFVTALTSNKLSSVAYSKDHPDEILTFDQTYLLFTATMANSGEEGGTWSNFDISSDTATTLEFDTETLDDIENVTDFYVYCELYSPLYDVSSFELTESTPRGQYWDYNPTTNVFSLLKINAWIYDELSGGSSSVLTFTPLTASTIEVTHPLEVDFSQMIDGYIYIDDGNSSVEYYAYDYGEKWTYVDGVFTDLTEALDFTSENLYVECNGSFAVNANGFIDFTGGFYFDMSYNYPSGYTQNCIITARNNITRKLYVETDYRGRLFRRYKAEATDWSAGTYNAGNIVRYLGYIWICLHTTTETPSDSSVYWMKMFDDASYYLYYSGFSYLPFNASVYYDSTMFNLTDFDGSTSPLYTSFKSSLGYDFDVVVKNINNITNTNITGTKLYINHTIQNSDLRIDNSILNQVYNSSIKQGYGLNSTQTINASTLGYISNCAFYSLDKSALEEAQNSFGRYIINLTKIKYLNNSFFSGYTYNNTVGWANYLRVFGTFQENDIVTIEYCTMSNVFERNSLSGYTRYVNFLNSFSGNVSMTRMYGTNDSTRMTFGVVTDNVFVGDVYTNYFSSTTQILRNFFGSKFHSNFTSATPSHASSTIANNTFNGIVAFWSGAGDFRFEGNKSLSAIYQLVFSNTSTALIRYNNFLKLFSDVGSQVRFLGTSGLELNYNQFFGEVRKVDFYLGTISYNTFGGELGRPGSTPVTFGSTGSIDFKYNYFGKDVYDKAFTTNLERTYDLRAWGSTTTSASDQIVTANFATGVKTVTTTYQILVTDHTIIADSASDFTVTLPVAVAGQEFIIKNINDGVVTLDGYSSDTIDGQTSLELRKFDVIKVKCYAANSWVQVNEGGEPSRTRVWTEDATITDSTWTLIPFNQTNWDNRAEWDSSTNYCFTAKETGWYDIKSRIELKDISGSTAEGCLKIACYINGTLWAYGQQLQLIDASGSIFSHNKIKAVMYADQICLNKGDTVQIYGYTDTGSDEYLMNSDGSACNYCAIHKFNKYN